MMASAACSKGLSFRDGLGFSASELAAVRIKEIDYFVGSGCEAANLLGRIRLADDIRFDTADTSIPDKTVEAVGSMAAVRRGLVIGSRYDISDLPASEAAFADCPAMNPARPGTPVMPIARCSERAVAIRIENGASGPLLFEQERVECSEGATAPPMQPVDEWTLPREAAARKLP